MSDKSPHSYKQAGELSRNTENVKADATAEQKEDKLFKALKTDNKEEKDKDPADNTKSP